MSYEVHGCKPEPGNESNIIRVPDSEAKFFTLYKVDEGIAEAIEDFPTREIATANIPQTAKALPVETPEQLAFLVADWHRSSCHHLLAVIEAPEDIELKVQFETFEPELITDSRERALFKLGVEYALNTFLKLPFESVPDEQSDQNPGDGS